MPMAVIFVIVTSISFTYPLKVVKHTVGNMWGSMWPLPHFYVFISMIAPYFQARCINTELYLLYTMSKGKCLFFALRGIFIIGEFIEK